MLTPREGEEPGFKFRAHLYAFLEGLEGRPEAERRFQATVGRLRAVVALVLIAALLFALVHG